MTLQETYWQGERRLNAGMRLGGIQWVRHQRESKQLVTNPLDVYPSGSGRR
jgi:hypothetical protein